MAVIRGMEDATQTAFELTGTRQRVSEVTTCHDAVRAFMFRREHAISPYACNQGDVPGSASVRLSDWSVRTMSDTPPYDGPRGPRVGGVDASKDADRKGM